MSNETGMNEQESNLRTIYQELCTSYRAIDDFRAKLLGFLPLATGTGIFLLYSQCNPLTPETKELLRPIGIFGIVITLGLFAYEIYGIRKCHALIATGKQIEDQLGMEGQFISRPPAGVHLINKPFAAGIIYPAVLAAWTYVALVFAFPQIAWLPAVLVFLVGFGSMVFYNR